VPRKATLMSLSFPTWITTRNIGSKAWTPLVVSKLRDGAKECKLNEIQLNSLARVSELTGWRAAFDIVMPCAVLFCALFFSSSFRPSSTIFHTSTRGICDFSSCVIASEVIVQHDHLLPTVYTIVLDRHCPGLLRRKRRSLRLFHHRLHN